MALHRDKGSPPEVSTSGGLRPNRHEVAAPVDGRIIIVQMGDGAKLRPPSMAIAYYQGDPSPW